MASVSAVTHFEKLLCSVCRQTSSFAWKPGLPVTVWAVCKQHQTQTGAGARGVLRVSPQLSHLPSLLLGPVPLGPFSGKSGDILEMYWSGGLRLPPARHHVPLTSHLCSGLSLLVLLLNLDTTYKSSILMFCMTKLLNVAHYYFRI